MSKLYHVVCLCVWDVEMLEVLGICSIYISIVVWSVWVWRGCKVEGCVVCKESLRWREEGMGWGRMGWEKDGGMKKLWCFSFPRSIQYFCDFSHSTLSLSSVSLYFRCLLLFSSFVSSYSLLYSIQLSLSDLPFVLILSSSFYSLLFPISIFPLNFPSLSKVSSP